MNGVGGGNTPFRPKTTTAAAPRDRVASWGWAASWKTWWPCRRCWPSRSEGRGH